MAVNQEQIMQQVLGQGGSLEDVARAIADAENAQGEMRPVAPTQGTGPQPDAQEPPAPPPPDILTKEQHAELLEKERRRWESGITPKLQAAKKMEELAAILQKNPQAGIQYLAAQYGVVLPRADEPRGPAAPPPPAEDTYQAEVKALRDKAAKAESFEEQWEVIDRLTDLKADRTARERVRPLQQTLLSQVEEQQIAKLESQGVANARQLLPQIKGLQDEVRRNPYLKIDEAVAILEGQALREENARLRAQIARPPTPPDEKRAGQVGGATAAAPGAARPADLTIDDLGRQLIAAGFAQDRQ